ncbi:MAG: 3-isopropylmalate dehydrogenase [Bacteroidales bacterium]|jgi:3-isopropylmalate dehydrogenase|nr:3-isopropylmalate dehydrogenase [Bacteroidales bacterium]
MNKKIAVLAGDGIGPEVMEQALKTVKAIEERFDHHFEYTTALVGAVAIEQTGNPYPDETHDVCMKSDAVLFGAIGDPKYDNDPAAKVRPEQGLLAMRKQLGLYANIRPVAAFASLLHKSPLKTELIEDVDFLVLRELTGGIYFGEPRGRSENGDAAFDTCSYHRYEVERIGRLAFEYARKRRKKLTAVDKANILATSRLWRETMLQLHDDYPDVELDFMFVDNAAMQLVTFPKKFDVLVTENMFGDILTDEASVITGSLGLLPSASIGLHTSVFEPVHGSYPQAAGKNIANPMGTILSAALMFEYALGMPRESKLIRQACEQSVRQGIVTADIAAGKPYSTSEVGDRIAQLIGNQE